MYFLRERPGMSKLLFWMSSLLLLLFMYGWVDKPLSFLCYGTALVVFTFTLRRLVYRVLNPESQKNRQREVSCDEKI